jgi:1-acyl-sn-glycerol-3-phosphate acyltransferase
MVDQLPPKLRALISVGRIYARLFYRYETYGVKNVPTTGPCIIGINHPGKLLGDMFAALAILPRRIPMVVRPEGMSGGGIQAVTEPRGFGEALAGRILQTGARGLPGIGISRAGDSPVAQNLAMLKALEQDRAVFIAVEGEVAWDGRLNRSRPGAPWLALRSGAPVLPVAVIGSYDIWPRWEINPRLTGKVIVRIGAPFRLVETVPEWIDDRMVEAGGDRIIAELRKLIG